MVDDNPGVKNLASREAEKEAASHGSGTILVVPASAEQMFTLGVIRRVLFTSILFCDATSAFSGSGWLVHGLPLASHRRGCSRQLRNSGLWIGAGLARRNHGRVAQQL